jgi:diguanylate cyclase (GGDEF)-like protein/PAS domain S-box-containing protein
MHLLEDSECIRTVLDALGTGVCLADSDGKIILWNTAAERLTGHQRQEVLGHPASKDFLEIMSADGSNEVDGADWVNEVLENGRSIELKASLKHKSGRRVLVMLRRLPLRDVRGTIRGAVQCLDGESQVADYADRHSKLAAYGCLDQTTGVLNHGMVESRLREALGTFAEHPVPVSILCIAVDRLEELGARGGGSAVAAAVREVGQTLENSLRPSDYLGRWRENEFLAVLPECEGDEVVRVGERLERAVKQYRVDWWGDKLEISVSMGATHARTNDGPQSVLRRGERGLREAIKGGGGCLVVWDEEDF